MIETGLVEAPGLIHMYEKVQDNTACACVCVPWGSSTPTDPAVNSTKEADGEQTHRALDSSGQLIFYKIWSYEEGKANVTVELEASATQT